MASANWLFRTRAKQQWRHDNSRRRSQPAPPGDVRHHRIPAKRRVDAGRCFTAWRSRASPRFARASRWSSSGTYSTAPCTSATSTRFAPSPANRTSHRRRTVHCRPPVLRDEVSREQGLASRRTRLRRDASDGEARILDGTEVGHLAVALPVRVRQHHIRRETLPCKFDAVFLATVALTTEHDDGIDRSHRIDMRLGVEEVAHPSQAGHSYGRSPKSTHCKDRQSPHRSQSRWHHLGPWDETPTRRSTTGYGLPSPL